MRSGSPRPAASSAAQSSAVEAPPSWTPTRTGLSGLGDPAVMAAPRAVLWSPCAHRQRPARVVGPGCVGPARFGTGPVSWVPPTFGDQGPADRAVTGRG